MQDLRVVWFVNLGNQVSPMDQLVKHVLPGDTGMSYSSHDKHIDIVTQLTSLIVNPMVPGDVLTSVCLHISVYQRELSIIPLAFVALLELTWMNGTMVCKSSSILQSSSFDLLAILISSLAASSPTFCILCPAGTFSSISGTSCQNCSDEDIDDLQCPIGSQIASSRQNVSTTANYELQVPPVPPLWQVCHHLNMHIVREIPSANF